MQLKNFSQLEIGLTLYNKDYGTFQVIDVNTPKHSFKFELRDETPTNWKEIFTHHDTVRFKIFSGDWEIVTETPTMSADNYLGPPTLNSRTALKDQISERICAYGDGVLEFSTRDITVLINWLEELERENTELKNKNHD